ncbi:MAG: Mrp/NBP35 family ATP-binding protein [Bacteroidetes bacterium]|nr:Mrp/NBP35 family ATP-binding protein [Bacteroidota bacterium]HET6245476.1 Mrp/NBP35 family ATP-binding protein [Bacteroidia bacterium]
MTKEKLIEALTYVIEPDLKKDIVALGLVSDIEIVDEVLKFSVKINNPAMHSRKRMEEACEHAIERFFGKGVKSEINILALPVESEREPEQRNILKQVKNTIAVASGKGGVGKSTVASNLAVSLALQGYKVGLVDADIYGPSIPMMFDVLHERPVVENIDGKSLIKPIESHGVKLLSIGFFADINQAVVWRGPMATKALTQLFTEANWGELDYLLIDLPPGTGDIHLSLVQTINLTGIVIVSTPQSVALADAKKGVAMFQLPQINIPILGIIENMAYFTPAELPENKYYIFGKDGAKILAETLEVPLLGQIPLVQSICESGDSGRPAVLQQTTPQALAFKEVTENLVEQVLKINVKFAKA